MNDWLGLHRFRSFEAARVFVHRLGLKSAKEWRTYCKSGKKPTDIPSAPHTAYAKDGWSDWGDWLGTETVATSAREYRSFEEARAYVRGLGLKSDLEWREYCKSGNKPVDIPTHPHRSYAQSGWAGVPDWLGFANSGHRSAVQKRGA
jgi:hypothetical protein